MVFVDLIQKGAYIDDEILKRELKKEWRKFLSDDDILSIIESIGAGTAYITKEPVEIEGKRFSRYVIDINPKITYERGLDRIVIEFLEVEE